MKRSSPPGFLPWVLLWLRWVPAVLLVAALSAWLLRPPAPADADAPLVPLPPGEVKGEVTVWSWNIAAKSLQGLVPEFQGRYPGVRVNVERTGARMQTRVMLSLQAGVGAPDVSQFQMAEARQYIATHQLADLTAVAARYRSDFPDYLWSNCVMDGRVYAIPWDMGPCAIYYKRAVFRRYGIDPERIETWDDYIAAGREIVRRSGGRTKMMPLGSGSLNNLFLILMQQTGGQVFDGEGRIAINSPEARQALDVIRRLRASGIGAEVLEGGPEFLAGFHGESIATYVSAVWLAGTIKDTVKDFEGGGHGWGVFRLPAVTRDGLRVANLGGSVLVIPAQCPDKAAAWAFVEHALCTRRAQARQYRTYDLFPAYLPALGEPEVAARDPFFDGQQVGLLFARDVTRIQRLNMPPGWNEATGYLGQALSHWAVSGMPSEGFFEELERKLHRRLGAPIAPAPPGGTRKTAERRPA